MNRTIILILLSSIFFQNVKGQEKKSSERYIKGWSVGILSDVGILQKYALAEFTEEYDANWDPVYDTVFMKYQRAKVVSIATFGFNNHFILKQINNDQSLSLNVFPTLGFSAMLSQGLNEMLLDKIINFSIPVFLNYNIGNLATFDTKKDNGFTIGLGAEYINPGLIVINDEDPDDDNFFEDGGYGRNGFPTKPYIQPSINMGYRFFSKTDAACELNLRYGFKSQEIYDKYNVAPAGDDKNSLTQWFKLSFVRYIGY